MPTSRIFLNIQWMALLKERMDREKHKEEFLDEPYALDKVTHRFSLTSWVRKKPIKYLFIALIRYRMVGSL